MLDLSRDYPRAWPDDLRPIAEDTPNEETFADWWKRNNSRLSNLHPLICEQWIHRHFRQSPANFLPLENLRWRLESLHTRELLASVHSEFSKRFDPEFDYEQLHGDLEFPKSPTAEAMDRGTWDYPIITLHTPQGIISSKGELPEVRLVLLEGHQRHRYLKALDALGKDVDESHKLFILELTAPLREA